MSWPTATPLSRRWVFALTAISAAVALPGHAQTAPAAQKRLSAAEEKNAPMTVQAQSIVGRPEREIILERDVDLVRGQTRLSSDTACYRQVEDDVDASGNVRMWRYGDQYTGDVLKLNLETGKGYMLNPTYKMELNNA